MNKILNKINKFSLSFLTFVFLFVFTTQQAKTETPTFIDAFNLNHGSGNGDHQPQGIVFANNGLKMYMTGRVNDNISEYTLTTAYDVSTASHVRSSFDISSQNGEPRDVWIKNDGTMIYIVGVNGNGRISRWSLGTAFDTSTASHLDDTSFSSTNTAAEDMFIADSGTKLFLISNDDDEVNSYTLSTAYDTSSKSHVTNFDLSNEDTRPVGFAFSNDGKKMFVAGDENRKLFQYNLTTAWDLSTASYSNISFIFSSQEFNPRGFRFNNDGTKMFVTGDNSDSVNEYTLPEPFTLLTPDLASSIPADNTTSVAADSNIVLNFSEIVSVQSGNITIKKTSDDSTFETIDVTGSKVTGSETAQITINPTSNFDEDIEYYVLIDATAFDNAAGASYAGISSTTALSFTTNVLPTLSSSTPADDATGVLLGANIILNFSEIVDVETGNITIKKTSDDSTFETIDVTSSNVTGTGTTQITVNLTSNFEAETEYYVLIDTTAFDDSSSNSYDGISSTTALSFTTESMVDPTTVKDVVGSIDVQSHLAKNSITQSTITVSSRLSYLRQNKDNQNLSKQNIKLDFGNAILTSLTNELLAKNDKSIIPDNWSSWSEGSISSSKIGDSSNSSSSETDAQSLALGFDTKLNDNDLLGFAIQYGKSDIDIGSSGTNVDSENINLSVYQTRPLNDDNFIEGMFGVGLIESDLVRIN